VSAVSNHRKWSLLVRHRDRKTCRMCGREGGPIEAHPSTPSSCTQTRLCSCPTECHCASAATELSFTPVILLTCPTGIRVGWDDSAGTPCVCPRRRASNRPGIHSDPAAIEK
jgi:hypothetical protein